MPTFSVAEGNFLSPFFARIFGPFAVFAMDAANELANLLKCGNRLASAVKDHVGRIKVDEQVVAFHVANVLQQSVR